MNTWFDQIENESAPSPKPPHPFYVATTIGLAVFLAGVVLWPSGRPAFLAQSRITVRVPDSEPSTHQTTVQTLASIASALSTQLNRLHHRPDDATPPFVAEHRINFDTATHDAQLDLRLRGVDPARMRDDLGIITSSMAGHLDQYRLTTNATFDGVDSRPAQTEVEDGKPSYPTVAATDGARIDTAATDTEPLPTASTQRREGDPQSATAAGTRKLAAWVSQPARSFVASHRSVSSAQVVVLGLLAVIAAGAALQWLPDEVNERMPQSTVTTPRDVARELDIPILATIGHLPSPQPVSARTLAGEASREATFFRWALRLGELTILLAVCLTVLHSARSGAFRESFIDNPLTTFRAAPQFSIWHTSAQVRTMGVPTSGLITSSAGYRPSVEWISSAEIAPTATNDDAT